MKRITSKWLGIAAGILFLAHGHRLSAQVDPHFSQYYANPLWLNPSLSGVIDGDYRVTANYRRQWSALNAPFVTAAISADMFPRNNWGIGFMVLGQKAADGGYHYMNGYLNVAYQVHLTEYQVLTGAFGLGLLNRWLDPSKLHFGDQYNPVVGYDPNMVTSEVFTNTSATSFDISAGLMYFDGNPNKKVNPFIGGSVYHPNKPKDVFITNGQSFIPMRFNFHAGAKIRLSEQADLTPHAIYIRQGTAQEITGGLYLDYKLDVFKDMIVGATYRVNDAIVPNVGFQVNGMIVGLSYDVNISALHAATAFRGGFEFSISYVHRKKIKDPKFICPRL